MITLAIQKQGRLHDKSFKLLTDAGIVFKAFNKHSLSIEADNFPIKLLLLRDDDIPECVDENTAQIGIVGENTHLEAGYDIHIREKLGFARCRLSLAVPERDQFSGLSYFNGKKIATSYPNILRRFFASQSIEVMIHELNGSVEIAPEIGLADAIFDIVSTGSTLKSHALKEVHPVLRSEAVLLEARDLTAAQTDIVQRLIFRISAVRQAANHKYIILNAPDNAIAAIKDILPGMKSPTITPLATAGWSSMSSVIEENTFWENIDRLKDAGAEGILVIPIEKMIV